MNTEKLFTSIRKAVKGQTRHIQIGRSHNSAGAGSGTPIRFVDGDQQPNLEGQPYLKTTFRNGSFQKTLYTYSTLEITVGKDWTP
jgi:hypothetical protein